MAWVASEELVPFLLPYMTRLSAWQPSTAMVEVIGAVYTLWLAAINYDSKWKREHGSRKSISRPLQVENLDHQAFLIL